MNRPSEEPGVALTPGLPCAVAAGVRRIVAPNAGMMTGPGTNTYLLGDGELAVLDPGPDEPLHLEALLAAAGPAPIRWIVVTHTHRDHSPLARRLAVHCGARLIGAPPPADGRQDESFAPDHVPGDGERLRLGAVDLIAIRTPGHASNCVCYLLPAEGLLFTGDHVLQGVSPVILPPDGDMTEYLDSLDKLAALDFERIAPGHGAIMTGGKQAVALLIRHRRAREHKVVERLRRGAATLEALTPQVYDDVPAERHAWAKLTLEAHLIKLQREGRVARHGDRWQLRGA